MNQATEADTITYKVRGLDCGEEVEILKQAVDHLEGVNELSFDVLNGRMTVLYDPQLNTEAAIREAIRSTGMEAAPWAERERLQEKETFWDTHGRLIMTCASGLLLAAGFGTHWLIHGSLLGVFGAGHGTEVHRFPAVSMVLYIGAIVTGGWYVAPRALAAVRRLRPDMHLLMVVAVIGAGLIGEWFEAATVAFLFSLSLLLEQWSVVRARHAISALLDLSPATARYVCPHDGEIEEAPVEDVPVGATVHVRPGERIPLDGDVLEGASSVNQAPITGESVPVQKERGDEVYAGTVNGDGALKFRATKPAEDTMLARIIHMVEQAESRRAVAEQWIETFARYYTPLMMALAGAIAVVPPLLVSAPWMPWIYRGLVILVIACPCALVISTPVSVVSGLASAARNGVLIKGGVFLETAGRLRALALDKTGTLTEGHPEVQSVVPFDQHTPEDLLQIAATLESHSEHALARAVVRKAEATGIQPGEPRRFQAIKGKGAEALIDEQRFWIGSHRLMHEKGQETAEVHDAALQLEDAGHTVVAVGNDRHVCGLIGVADPVREEAPRAIAKLKDAGIRKLLMLTGDNEGTARAVAEYTGVDEYRAELLPEDKVAAVEAMTVEYEHVAVVGDGINDAPAMAASGYGVAMGAMGTDVAIETADVALMADDLDKLPWLVRHSRRTLRTIKINVAFALGLKAAFIVLAVFGLATLWMAIAADMGASLLVTFNGLRLLRVKGEKPPE